MGAGESSEGVKMIEMMFYSILAGGAWKTQHNTAAGILVRCQAMQVYGSALNALRNGGWM